jgi:hypothetical protein
MPRLELPSVTLCAASSVNIDATVEAIRASADRIDFAECLLFTDAAVSAPAGTRVIPVPRLASGRDYSQFLLHGLVNHIRTPHCLVVQWDGFVLDPGCWDPAFLDYDYVGAPWPQFRDDRDVGNGGFSLRSMKLLQACQDPAFVDGHPEDVAICRTNRELLEQEYGIRFANRDVAGRFAFERTTPLHPTFGFHGVFNMIAVLGIDRFRTLYGMLDDRQTVFRDCALLVRQLKSIRSGKRFGLRIWWDRLRAGLRGPRKD